MSSEEQASAAQKAMCKRFGVLPVVVSGDMKLGIARNVRDGVWPINGLRHQPHADFSGWYIWAGEHLSDAEDFFQPQHVRHLTDRCPDVLPYLALPAGWRFLIAPDYEDVWRDPSLLDV